MTEQASTTPPPPPKPAPTPALPYGDQRKRQKGWQSNDVARAAAILMAMYATALVLWEARALVLLTFLGILFGLAVATGVNYLERFRVPRGIGAAIIVLGTLGIMVGTLAWSAPTLRSQSLELRQKFPEALDRVDRWLESRRSGIFGSLLTGSAAADSAVAVQTAPPGAPAARVARDTTAAGGGSALRRQIMSRLGGAQRFLFPFVTSTVTAIGAVLYLIFLAIYVGAEPNVYHSGVMHLFPHRSRKRAAEVLTAVGIVLRKWLVTQLIAMLAIGTVTTIVLLVLGIPAALPLGIIAGFLEFIPTLGPVISAIPAVVMGFVDSPEKAAIVAIAYVGIQFLENHILIPLLMREGVDLPPALTIIAQALMAILFGFLGLLVAVPALAATMVTVKMLYVEDVVGDEMEVVFTEEGAEAAS